MKVGDIVEAIDFRGKWQYALLQEKIESELLVHFLGRDPDLNDEWVDLKSVRTLQNRIMLDISAKESVKEDGKYKGDREIIDTLIDRGLISHWICNIGDVVKARNSRGVWMYALIKDTVYDKFRIHFLGWGFNDEYFTLERMEKDIEPLEPSHNSLLNLDFLAIESIENEGRYEGDKEIIDALRQYNLLTFSTHNTHRMNSL